MYKVEFSESVVRELKRVRAYDRSRILDEIEKQLVHTPNLETRNRKQLMSLVPTFEASPPIWELRVGEHRVFYDVDEEAGKVYVRALRKKPPHQTTEESL